MSSSVALCRPAMSPAGPTKFVPNNVANNVQEPLTPRATAEIVAVCLREVVGADGHAAKRLARAAHSTKEAADNWLSGRNAPNLAAFLNLCRAYPALQAQARRLMALAGDLDPELQRDLAALQRTIAKLTAGSGEG